MGYSKVLLIRTEQIYSGKPLILQGRHRWASSKSSRSAWRSGLTSSGDYIYITNAAEPVKSQIALTVDCKTRIYGLGGWYDRQTFLQFNILFLCWDLLTLTFDLLTSKAYHSTVLFCMRSIYSTVTKSEVRDCPLVHLLNLQFYIINLFYNPRWHTLTRPCWPSDLDLWSFDLKTIVVKNVFYVFYFCIKTCFLCFLFCVCFLSKKHTDSAQRTIG